MLYGRDGERERIGVLLDSARASASGALVLRGAAGVGKTALLEDARERAGDMHVLIARGVESELELPFAALHQLLRPVLEHVGGLPPPQASALSGALGLAEGPQPERFLVYAACLSLLSEASERRPVLALVDDAHWLDTASADALTFVARRLGAEGIVLLFAAREGDVRRFDAPGVPSLELEGLDQEAAELLLARGAGVEAAPSVRERLVARTGGNALALLEVPTALTGAQLAGDEPLPEALPMTRAMEVVFLERVRRLSAGTQRLLLVAAADDSERVALVLRAGESLGIDRRALDEAEEAGLLSIFGGRLTFRHPLVRSAVYEGAATSERWAAHRALADALAQDEAQSDRRAWHLAASAVEPDESVVRALEEAAARAEGRAGHESASRALERAAELSADPAARGRRLVSAARAASVAGSDERAVELARRAATLVEDAVLRAEIERILGLAEIQGGRPSAALPRLLTAATEIASLAPRNSLELLMYAHWAASDGVDADAQLAAGRLASTAVPPQDDGWSAFMVDLLTGNSAMAAGETERGIPPLERAIAWASAADDEQHLLWAAASAFWLGDDEQGAALAERSAALARTRGSVSVLANALGALASLRFLAQRFDDAALAAEEALTLARELGAVNLETLPLTIVAGLAAIRGDEERTRRHADEVLATASAHGLPLRAGSAVRALALLDLGLGRWSEALRRYEEVADVRPGHGNPVLAMTTVPDRIEAAVRAGEPGRAAAALAAYEAWAAEAGARWMRPRIASSRALLTEGDEATAWFEEALLLAPDARPFDLARIQLLYGEHLRRERRRTDARAQLRAAEAGFERMGADPWAARARSELRASGETARRGDPSAALQLTPQELQVARFVAEGLSNKEVAAQLYLSPRTIDAHLRKVFAKLGITSRGQLARRLDAEDGSQATAAPRVPA